MPMMGDSHTDGIIYIVSDAHIGAPFQDALLWEREFIAFIDAIPDNVAALYILGDLFDFWIEYGSIIRADYFNVLHALRKLIERGIAVHYFAGNHDFAFGPFITETLGMIMHPGHVVAEIQARRIHLYHGDGLIRRDIAYRTMKRVLRNSLAQALYKLLPVKVGISLAAFCSISSRKARECYMSEKIVDEYRQHALSYLKNGSDIVFFGHSHHAELLRWGEKIYCNTGAWMRHYNYATLTGGEVRLWRYRSGDSQEIQAMDWNKGSSAS
jgi:UDP-2,3-diacylglucosamine hydrolase